VADQLALGLGYVVPPGLARRLLAQWKARRHLGPET
jgi:hypothetical protein